MSDHPPAERPEAGERDARISELAAGFALGELTDTELQELYNALREPGESGLHAAHLAWQQLGVVTDLRAGLGATFQAVAKHRLSREGLSDRFVRESRKRLGLARHVLGEIDEPRSRPRMRWRRMVLGCVLMLAITGSIAAWIHLHVTVLARVSAVEGTATLGGDVLVPGMAVDSRQVVVPAGSQIALTWVGRATVIISGPSNAIAQPEGISLSNGCAWYAGSKAFTVGLPDGTLHSTTESRVAIEVRDGVSLVGVARGTLQRGHTQLGANEAMEGASVFPWIRSDLNTLPDSTPAAPAWMWEMRSQWHDLQGQISWQVTDSSGSSGSSFQWRPGVLQIQALNSSVPVRTMTIPGPPLESGAMVVTMRHHRLVVSFAGQVVTEEAVPTPSQLQVSPLSRASLSSATYQSGPLPRPPLLMPDLSRDVLGD